MIGEVRSLQDMILPLRFRDSFGTWNELEVSIDTGFSGALALSPQLILTLNLPFDRHTRLSLANGTVFQCDRYIATIEWHGREEEVLAYEIETPPLLGMALLFGSELKAQFIIGGMVEITELPLTR